MTNYETGHSHYNGGSIFFVDEGKPKGVHSGDRVGFDTCHSVRLYFGSVIFWMRVTAGHTRIRLVCHGSVEDWLFNLSG